MKPELIVHCDWSVDPRKRWLAAARFLTNGSYEVAAPVLVGATQSLFSRLREKVPSGPILAGFDFPIGVPRAYAERAGFGRFPEMLLTLGTGRSADFYNPAFTSDQISLARPFYPRTPGGTSKQQLVAGLGLASAADLLRQCDRQTSKRGKACELFWTLGANQVGPAAIHGWREVLAPAMRHGTISIWPFDGELPLLLASGGIVVVESYPAEIYSHLGFARAFGKRSRDGRRSQSATILSWCERNPIVLQPQLVGIVENGFGDLNAGEDAFDAFIGLLGMIEAVCNPARCLTPQDAAVQNIEGWILGMDPTCTDALPVLRTRGSHGHTTKRAAANAGTPTEKGCERLCPACHQKMFARWPLGWDAHAAYRCTGIEGDSPEARKRAYRERYLG